MNRPYATDMMAAMHAADIKQHLSCRVTITKLLPPTEPNGEISPEDDMEGHPMYSMDCYINESWFTGPMGCLSDEALTAFGVYRNVYYSFNKVTG